MKQFLSIDSETIELLATPLGSGRYRIRAGAQDFEVDAVTFEGGQLQFVLDGIRCSFDCAVTRDAVWLGDSDDSFHFSRVEELASGERSEAAAQLTSQMPGKVLAHSVAPGSAVSKGAVLLILEAMKMEHEIVAPGDGVLEEFLLQPGERVMPGDLLVRFSPAEPAAG